MSRVLTCSTKREMINDIIDHTLDETFAALADPTRRRIVELLQSGPRRGERSPRTSERAARRRAGICASSTLLASSTSLPIPTMLAAVSTD